MRLVLTAIIFLGGLFTAFTGLQFLFDPVSMASNFGMGSENVMGVAAIRGDMTAFFFITGFSMLYGVWKRNGDILLIPAFMFGCALLGRSITAFTHGTMDGFFLPMAFEAFFTIACLIGSRLLPHPVTKAEA